MRKFLAATTACLEIFGSSHALAKKAPSTDAPSAVARPEELSNDFTATDIRLTCYENTMPKSLIGLFTDKTHPAAPFYLRIEWYPFAAPGEPTITLAASPLDKTAPDPLDDSKVFARLESTGGDLFRISQKKCVDFLSKSPSDKNKHAVPSVPNTSTKHPVPTTPQTPSSSQQAAPTKPDAAPFTNPPVPLNDIPLIPARFKSEQPTSYVFRIADVRL